MTTKQSSRCPICDAEIQLDTYTLDNSIILEQYEHCNAGHYSYEFVYSSTRVFVGETEFTNYYSQNNDKEFWQQVDRACEEYKAKLNENKINNGNN